MRVGVWAAAVMVACVCIGCGGVRAQHHPASARHHADVLGDARSPAAASTSRPARAWRPPPRPSGAAYLMARISRPLHTRFGIVRAKTQFGGAVWVPVIHRRGAQASLLVPLGPAGRIVQTSLRPLALRWSSTRVVVDLGAARLTVYQAGRRPAAFPIGEGAPSSPTPVGRFFVTDRLPFPVGSPYAPFALGLSAHQTHLAPTWIGGDQIAIHPGPMGAISNGCIHVGFPAITLLRRTAALGTLVTVQH